MIEKHRNYTVKELKELLGPNWIGELGIPCVPLVENKPVIDNFDEFDEETKQIYLGIYNLVKSKNKNKDISVWATGSRVKGNWRTKEESESVLIKYPNMRVKYSDYDYITNATIRPTKEEFFEALGVAVDYAGGEGHKVLITV